MITKFAYEVPIAHLKDFDQYQDLYFALSFLCINLYYINFIKENRGDRLLIIDNSFNELGVPDTPDRMAKLFHELNADFVVSPDCDSWSLEQLRSSYREMISLVPQDKVLPVVKSIEERNMFLEEGAFKYCTTYEQRSKLPPVMLDLSYHFLGLLSPIEIKRHTPNSCDTSMPIKLALIGETIFGWCANRCPHIKTNPDFFDLTLTSKELTLAKENCEWISVHLAR